MTEGLLGLRLKKLPKVIFGKWLSWDLNTGLSDSQTHTNNYSTLLLTCVC